MSSDYGTLVAWMEHKTIACVLDVNGRRVIAEASAFPVGDVMIYCVDSVDRMIISGTKEHFIERCEEREVEFIDPRLSPETSTLATVLMWIGAITTAAILSAIILLIFRMAI